MFEASGVVLRLSCPHPSSGSGAGGPVRALEAAWQCHCIPRTATWLAQHKLSDGGHPCPKVQLHVDVSAQRFVGHVQIQWRAKPLARGSHKRRVARREGLRWLPADLRHTTIAGGQRRASGKDSKGPGPGTATLLWQARRRRLGKTNQTLTGPAPPLVYVQTGDGATRPDALEQQRKRATCKPRLRRTQKVFVPKGGRNQTNTCPNVPLKEASRLSSLFTLVPPVLESCRKLKQRRGCSGAASLTTVPSACGTAERKRQPWGSSRRITVAESTSTVTNSVRDEKKHARTK